MFNIDPITGVVRLNDDNIDLSEDKYELNITATDDSSCCVKSQEEPHISTAVVVVFITDVNDHKPVFTECVSYAATPPIISRDATIGTPVLNVTAKDLDKGNNGAVKYSIVNKPNKSEEVFRIDEQTGEIFTNKVLTEEDTGPLWLTVKAQDGYYNKHGWWSSNVEPRLQDICSFSVRISNGDQKSVQSVPKIFMFDQPFYKISISEEVQPSSPILKVVMDFYQKVLIAIIAQVKAAYGNNQQKNIVYFLAADEEDPVRSYFHIDETTGDIRLIQVKTSFPDQMRTLNLCFIPWIVMSQMDEISGYSQYLLKMMTIMGS